MKSILLVEDDVPVAEELAEVLERYGFRVKAVRTINQFRSLQDIRSYDLIVVDLSLPDGHGNEVIRIARAGSNAGIVVLSGHHSEVDKVLALEIGADDYVEKPYRISEFIARIQSLLRRLERSVAPLEAQKKDTFFEFDGWKVDTQKRRFLNPDEEEVLLTKTEFDVLEIFLNHQDKVLSREQIVIKLRGGEWAGYDRAIDGIVSRLRAKFAAHKCDVDYFRTVRGVGYLFSATQ